MRGPMKRDVVVGRPGVAESSAVAFGRWLCGRYEPCRGSGAFFRVVSSASARSRAHRQGRALRSAVVLWSPIAGVVD